MYNKVFITGILGFLCSHLADFFLKSDCRADAQADD